MNSFRPHITVATLVEDQGRLLHVRERVNDRLVLNQPAGHVEAGETLLQAAFRETLEETAWQVEIDALLGVYIFQPSLRSGIFYRFAFVARPLQHDRQQKLDTGIEEALWLTPEEILARRSEHRAPLVARCIEDWQRGQRLPLDVIYQHPWPLQQR